MTDRYKCCWIALCPCLGLAACQQTRVIEKEPTQVFVLGMIHGKHRTSEKWGLEQLRGTIRAIDPDVICVEIPPANWPGALATWNEKHIVEDSRVKVFPEYVDVVMPLLDEMNFTVVPCAGWTQEMASARRESMQRFRTSEEHALAFAAYQKDEATVDAWMKANPAPAAADDPHFIHSHTYDARTKMKLGPYDMHLNEVIGHPGGWTYINQEHFDLIAAAIAANPGKRILVTFGAGHKYWFLEQLRKMDSVQLMDVGPYLPPVELTRRASAFSGIREVLRKPYAPGRTF